MQLLIEIHNELAKSSIGMGEYTPISMKLLEAKNKLRNEQERIEAAVRQTV